MLNQHDNTVITVTKLSFNEKQISFAVTSPSIGVYKIKTVYSKSSSSFTSVLPLMVYSGKTKLELVTKSIDVYAGASIPWMYLTFNQPVFKGRFEKVSINDKELNYFLDAKNRENTTIKVNTTSFEFTEKTSIVITSLIKEENFECEINVKKGISIEHYLYYYDIKG